DPITYGAGKHPVRVERRYGKSGHRDVGEPVVDSLPPVPSVEGPKDAATRRGRVDGPWRNPRDGQCLDGPTFGTMSGPPTNGWCRQGCPNRCREDREHEGHTADPRQRPSHGECVPHQGPWSQASG